MGFGSAAAAPGDFKVYDTVTKQWDNALGDDFGKLKVGVIEYIKLYAQNLVGAKYTEGVTHAGTTYNHLLCYPEPLGAADEGSDSESGTTTATTETTVVDRSFLGLIRYPLKLYGIAKVRVSFSVAGATDTTTGNVQWRIYADLIRRATDGTETSLVSKDTGLVTEAAGVASLAETPRTVNLYLDLGTDVVQIKKDEAIVLRVRVAGTFTVGRTFTGTLKYGRGTDETALELTCMG